ncbi:MAG: PilZ domain-containing protein [Gemmataceae bacterium]|nr:PilZ domain-containing protein [Gemmataceae bacterium]
MFNWFRRSASKPAVMPGDQRAAPRVACDRKTNENLIVSVGMASWPALVRDISTSGVSLVIGQRHEPGTRLPMCLVNTRKDLRCPIEMEVVHTLRRPDGYWLAGCAFQDRQLNAEELEGLL